MFDENGGGPNIKTVLSTQLESLVKKHSDIQSIRNGMYSAIKKLRGHGHQIEIITTGEKSSGVLITVEVNVSIGKEKRSICVLAVVPKNFQPSGW